MNEPWNRFRTLELRTPTDLEALSNLSMFEKGKLKAYRCSLIDEECRYDQKTGAGDCRRCNFALAHIMENPGIWRRPADK